MNVKVGREKEINFLWFYVGLLALFSVIFFLLLYVFNISYMNIFFGSFMILLLIVLAYYWTNSRGYYNNLGRIRRTFYTLYLFVMSIGFVTGNIEQTNWQLLLQLTGLVVFVDLAVFQNPNILKMFNAEFKHDDEIRGALADTKDTILQNALKVEKFTEVIQETEEYLLGKPIPESLNEYKAGMENYLEIYAETFGFHISLFIFPSPNQDAIKENIETQLKEVQKRHVIELSSKQDEIATVVQSLSNGETIIWKEEKLISVPFFGIKNSMIATLEAKNVPVDGVDASHISSMMVIFEWYMTGDEVEEDERILQENS